MQRNSDLEAVLRTAVRWWWDRWQDFGRASGGVPLAEPPAYPGSIGPPETLSETPRDGPDSREFAA